jgi:flagellar hook-associated protein 1 FlgK
MSLFGSIQLAGNTLRVADIGLQVVGNNIANANTPGYARQELVLAPAPTQRKGNLLLGLGVQVVGIVQKLDANLQNRLRDALSDTANSATQRTTYEQLEGLLGELGENDLSTTLNAFFASINDVLNQPESASVRNLAVLKGQTLANEIGRLASRVRNMRSDLDARVVDGAKDINRLLTDIRDLNIKIAESEGGASRSDAAGLRDQRNVALDSLAKLVNIRVEEQASGGVAVFTSSGDYLVFEGNVRQVEVQNLNDRGQSIAEIRLTETNSPLALGSGELGGLVTSRDTILGGFLDNLDEFARTLAFEFNKVHSSGQGLKGYSTITAENAVTNVNAALDNAGLPYTPVNGTFEVQVYNTRTKLTQTTRIKVDLDGIDGDTTLSGLQAELNGIDGITASINSAGKLTLTSNSADQQIAFADDTSGLLAALGINKFFTGSSALNLQINQAVAKDPALFAASAGGVGNDTENGVLLGGFLDRALESNSGASLSDMYLQMTGEITQASAVSRSVYEGFQVFEDSLQGQALAATGVNMDEEALKMLTYQRMYQASAKLISTINELLGVLLNL